MKTRLLYLKPSPYRAVNTFHLGYENLLKTKHRLLYLKPSPYRAINTFHLGYENILKTKQDCFI
jgi:hypothetical protein